MAEAQVLPVSSCERLYRNQSLVVRAVRQSIHMVLIGVFFFGSSYTSLFFFLFFLQLCYLQPVGVIVGLYYYAVVIRELQVESITSSIFLKVLVTECASRCGERFFFFFFFFVRRPLPLPTLTLSYTKLLGIFPARPAPGLDASSRCS